MSETTIKASDLARIEALKMRADAIKLPVTTVANVYWDTKVTAAKDLIKIADKLYELADKMEEMGR